MARLRADQKLFLSYLLLIAAVVVALTVGVGSTLRRNLVDRLVDDMRRELALTQQLHRHSPFLDADSTADWLGALSGRRVTLIAPDGHVIGDSERARGELGGMENHAARPEVRAARRGEVGRSARVSSSIGAEMLYMAVAAEDGVVIRMADPMSEMYAAVSRVQRGIFGVGLVALILAGALSFGATTSWGSWATSWMLWRKSCSAGCGSWKGNAPRCRRSSTPWLRVWSHGTEKGASSVPIQRHEPSSDLQMRRAALRRRRCRGGRRSWQRCGAHFPATGCRRRS